MPSSRGERSRAARACVVATAVAAAGLACSGSGAAAPGTIEAGVDQWVSAGAMVTLSGSAPGDPGTWNYTWRQIGGPDVTLGAGSLSGKTATFVAPASVCLLGFELHVDDGRVEGTP